jgi:hypothetical protein
MSKHLPSRAAWPFVALIFVLPFILLWRWTLRGETLFWGTPLFQFWPWHHLAKRSLLAGAWPLWNPLLGNGTPLLANLQSAVFYPPNLLYLLLPVEHAFTLSVLLHLSLAGLLMYAYGRQIGLLPFAATLAALSYMLGGYIIGRTQFVTMVNAAAWLPLLLLLSEKIATRREVSARYSLGLGLALAVQLLAGHAQLWFYSLCLIGAYLIFRCWMDWSALLRAAWWLGLAVGLAILLAAVQLLPTAEFTLESSRGGGAERTFALTYSFWPWRLLTLLAPNFFGNPGHADYWGYANYWEDHAYVGVLPFLLAMAGVAAWYRRWLVGEMTHRGPDEALPWAVVPFFAALVPVSLILAMGWNTPLYLLLFDYVPGFGYFQAPARLLIGYSMAMPVLAGVGAQSFRMSPAGRGRWKWLFVVALGVAVAGLAGLFILSGRSLTFPRATLALGVWLTLSVGLVLARPQQSGTSRWQWLAIALVIADLWWAAWPLLPTLPPAIFQQPLVAAERLHDGRFFMDEQLDYDLKFKRYFRFETFGPVEVPHWQTFRETLAPNLGVYAGLPSANNDDPLVVGRWRRLTDLLEEADDDRRVRLLALMSVSYFITRTATGEVVTERVPDPLPRAYFVPRVYFADDEAGVIARLTAPDFDPRQEVVILTDRDSLPPSPPGRGAGGEGGEGLLTPAAVIVSDANRVALTVDAPADGFVVLADTFYPGWQATVDGQPTPIWPANLALRAVAVEAGRHEVIFEYRPASFRLGLAISSAALLAVGIIWVRRVKGQCFLRLAPGWL